MRSEFSKKIGKLIVLLALAFVLLTPYISSAAISAFSGPIIPTCNSNLVNGHFTDPCNFGYLVQLANKLLSFAVYISVPIAAICFAWAGFLYLTAAGNTGQIGKAHGIFLDVAIGLVIVLAAWLVVNFIVTALGSAGSYINLLQNTS